MTTTHSEDSRPTPDTAEENAYFPSPYSLSLYTTSKTDFSNASYPKAYKGGKWKVLMIASQERYLMMQNGKFFSTGNHPVEMLLPMYHMDLAGFDIDIVTPSGNPVKLEMWAFPTEDEVVKATYEKYRHQLKQPKKLSDVVKDLNAGNYIGVFIPGGHGVLNDIPFSKDVKTVLFWAHDNERYVISLCHGPAGLLSAGIDEGKDDFLYRGYEMCVFPDSLDTGANIDIGYIPGPMPWLVGERLRALGVKILNTDITGTVHKDRLLLTGDSPLASNNLGKLAAETLLEAVAHQ
ncbi:glyoxalase III HchA [Hafnia paralvei]|uniref:Protein deglycase HchA n=1 Tax=Hafnia paralvei TaxID=546367 RepID=A0A4Q9EQQ9_9GAMM|nr:glyoxalase III HchA [Hafnia paralvei]TBM28338.1 protein deglycase HchA [Hafnia paralvei]